MKTTLKSMFWLGIALFFSYLLSQQMQTKQATELQNVKPKATKNRIATVTTKSKPSPSSNQAPEPENKDLVPFKVIKGEAIAYGDIFLGTPEDPEVEEGYYKIPIPQLWDRPEIPYVISEQVKYPERIKEAMKFFKQTAIEFIPYEGQPDFLVFENTEEHCYSLLGRHGGAQPIRLSIQCGPQEIAHEILHALGFVHEQSRQDRDAFVEILWDNIEPKYKDQFSKVPEVLMQTVRDIPFDYNSILLYRPDTFRTSSGLFTMRSRSEKTIAPIARGLSAGDLQKIHRLYPK